MKKIFVEIADTTLKRELGLMNRKYLPTNCGMLFKFPSNHYRSFWMKDTYLPLDIAFIDDDERILQIEEGSPLNQRPIHSDTKCRYVLEMNQGWFESNGLNIGSRVAGQGINPSYVKKAQALSPAVEEMPPAIDNGMMPQFPGQEQEQPQQPSPDVEINKSFRQICEEASLKGKDLLIMYQKKDGYILPPKLISPPYLFEPDENGKANAIIKGWDNQDAQWKSFLIDNILDVEEKEADYYYRF